MQRPIFELGDEVVLTRPVDGPFLGFRGDEPIIIDQIETNKYPDVCTCGASPDNDYTHDPSGTCCPAPAQWVFVREGDRLIVGDNGEAMSFSSCWFVKA